MMALKKVLFAYYMLLALSGFIGLPILASGFLLSRCYICCTEWELVYAFLHFVGASVIMGLTYISYPGVCDGVHNTRQVVLGDKE